jgi:tetratricopeptide (TPR) repeat protein
MKLLLSLLFLLNGAVCELVVDEGTLRHKDSWKVAVNSADLKYKSGLLLLQKGKKELALKLFQDAVSMNPTRHDCWTGLADAQSQTGQLKEASASLERALALAPPNKPLPKSFLQLQESVEQGLLLNPTSLVDCDYGKFFQNKVSSIEKELKRGKLSKDNQDWVDMLSSAVQQLTEAGFKWEETNSKQTAKKGGGGKKSQNKKR